MKRQQKPTLCFYNANNNNKHNLKPMCRWDITGMNSMNKKSLSLSLVAIIIATFCLSLVGCNKNNQPTPQVDEKQLPEIAFSLFGLDESEVTSTLKNEGYSREDVGLVGTNELYFIKENHYIGVGLVNSVVTYIPEAGQNSVTNVAETYTKWFDSALKCGFNNFYCRLFLKDGTEERYEEYEDRQGFVAALQGKTDDEIAFIGSVMFNVSQGMTMEMECEISESKGHVIWFEMSSGDEDL